MGGVKRPPPCRIGLIHGILVNLPNFKIGVDKHNWWAEPNLLESRAFTLLLSSTKQGNVNKKRQKSLFFTFILNVVSFYVSFYTVASSEFGPPFWPINTHLNLKNLIHLLQSKFNSTNIEKCFNSCQLTKKHTCTVEEAAAILGISRNSAYEGVKQGQIPSIRVGKRILVLWGPLMKKIGAPESETGWASQTRRSTSPRDAFITPIQ